MSRRNRVIHLATLIILALFCSSAFSATNIDSSFGDEGTILLNSGLGDDESLAIGVQSDGMIITAGYASNGSVKMLSVSRFTEDGEIDTDFNSAGTLTLSLGSGDTIAQSLTIQDDDKIVISGSVEDSSGNSIIIARITDEGYLDTSYGSDSNGYLTYSVDSATVETSNVLVDDDGNIIVSATVAPTSSSSNYGYFIKTDTDGNADTSFDDDGQANITFSSGDIEINAIRLQSDGKILAGGATTVDGALQASLIRVNTDGSLDTTYGSDGASVLDIDGTSSTVYDLAIDDDSNVVIAGSLYNDYNQSFLGKLDGDGNEVTSFGTSGIYTTTYSLENIAYSVSIQSDGTVTATGFMTSSTGKDVFVLSVTENSSSQISSTTYIATDIAGEDDVAYSVTALDDGNVLTAGSSYNGEDLDSAVLRFTDDTSAATSDSSSSSGIVTSGFRVVTAPITDITRVGAMTGGKITQLETASCEDTCESSCGDTTSTCYTNCISTCVDDLTVTLRGVVYGTSSNPTYDSDDSDSDDSSDTTDDSTDDSDDDSDSDSDTTSAIFPDDPGYAIVRSGYTSDGEGTGSYESELTDITPGTMYYVRAYAVLSDDTVIYGNQYSFATDDACFIATAAFGSIFEKHVVLLRQFRDSYLLTNPIGERFVAIYYHYSPWVADIIRDHEQLKALVRFLLTPFVALAFFLLKTTLATKVLCITTGLIAILWLGTHISFKTGFHPMKRIRINKVLTPEARKESGFTLIELLVVLVIIGVLAGYIGPKIMGRPEEAKRTKAGLQIRAIETALKMYKLDNGSYPSTEQGLQALVEPPSTGKLPPKWRDGGYMEKGKVPLDPWGYEFVYLSPGVNSDFDLSSYGGDGEAGGDGDAQDINNWEIE